MPREGSGSAIGLPHIRASPDESCSKPAMMRKRVDLPQPDAPIRQTNSPLRIERLASDKAWIVWSCSWKTFETRLISTMGRAGSAMMVGAPAQQPVADQHDDPVGEIARDADHDHAADHQLGARQRSAVHDDGAQALRHAGHLADHDDEPGEAQPQPQASED